MKKKLSLFGWQEVGILDPHPRSTQSHVCTLQENGEASMELYTVSEVFLFNSLSEKAKEKAVRENRNRYQSDEYALSILDTRVSQKEWDDFRRSYTQYENIVAVGFFDEADSFIVLEQEGVIVPRFKEGLPRWRVDLVCLYFAIPYKYTRKVNFDIKNAAYPFRANISTRGDNKDFEREVQEIKAYTERSSFLLREFYRELYDRFSLIKEIHQSPEFIKKKLQEDELLFDIDGNLHPVFSSSPKGIYFERDWSSFKETVENGRTLTICK